MATISSPAGWTPCWQGSQAEDEDEDERAAKDKPQWLGVSWLQRHKTCSQRHTASLLRGFPTTASLLRSPPRSLFPVFSPRVWICPAAPRSRSEPPLPRAAVRCALPFPGACYSFSWHGALLRSAGVIPLCPLMCCTPPLGTAEGDEPWPMIRASPPSSAAAAWPGPWDFQVGNPSVLLWVVARSTAC